MPFLLKVLVSALIIATVSELAKRQAWMGALLISLPVSSLLSLGWLYFDTKDKAATGQFALGILWMVIPSLVFFPVLFLLTKTSLNFWVCLVFTSIVTAAAYAGFSVGLSRFGLKI